MNHLKKYRVKAGLSQKKLAVLCGWISDEENTSRIANYESGNRTPSLDNSRQIINVINAQGVTCSLDDVFPPKIKVDAA